MQKVLPAASDSPRSRPRLLTLYPTFKRSYLAFDDISSPEGGTILEEVLANIEQKAAEESRKVGTGKDLFAAINAHCTSNKVVLSKWNSPASYGPFPNILSATVCCDCLQSVAQRYSERLGFGDLMIVLLQGLFCCIFKGYDKDRWFFQQKPYFLICEEQSKEIKALDARVKEFEKPPQE